jgi:hypothetical protein
LASTAERDRARDDVESRERARLQVVAERDRSLAMWEGARLELLQLRRALADARRLQYALTEVLARAQLDRALLRSALEASERRGARLRQTLHAASTHFEALARDLDKARGDWSHERQQVEETQQALGEIERRLDELYASRTWRWTAALRLGWRLLRR